MAYEIVKTVRGRAYRYRVESVRDPASGRSKATWTYLGRAETAESASKLARPPSRERLLGALERLLETHAFDAVTAGAIATEAGLAHGTFYRYFRDKDDALAAALVAVGERVDRFAIELDGDIGDERHERARVRTWIRGVLDTALATPGLLRTWSTYSETNAVAAATRSARQEVSSARIVGYLERLHAAAVIVAPDPHAIANGIMLMMKGTLQLARDGAAEELALGTARCLVAVERLVFGEPA